MLKKKGSQTSHSSAHTAHVGSAAHSAHGSNSHSVHHGHHNGSTEGHGFAPASSFQNFQNPCAIGQLGDLTGINFFGGAPRLALAYDIYQDGDSLVIEIPFPRLNPQSLTITQENRVLKISGSTEVHTTKASASQTRVPLFVQIPRGHFEQLIHLPLAVQEGHAKASFEDGVLIITIKLLGSGRENRVHVSFA